MAEAAEEEDLSQLGAAFVAFPIGLSGHLVVKVDSSRPCREILVVDLVLNISKLCQRGSKEEVTLHLPRIAIPDQTTYPGSLTLDHFTPDHLPRIIYPGSLTPDQLSD